MARSVSGSEPSTPAGHRRPGIRNTDVIGSRRVARLDDAIETLESVGDVRALTARL